MYNLASRDTMLTPEVWRKLFDRFKQNDHIYEGFPVKCAKHPDRTALLSSCEQNAKMVGATNHGKFGCDLPHQIIAFDLFLQRHDAEMRRA